MSWVDWVGLSLTIVLLALLLHAWLLWRTWGKLRVLGGELSSVLERVGELSDQLGELRLAPDQGDQSPRDQL